MTDSEPKSSACPVTQLRLIGLFGGLSEDAMQWLSETLGAAWYEAGATVFHEGDPAREIFVVLTGELEVLKKSATGYEARVAMLGVHDWFGEMSVLDVQPRSATVRALAPTRLLRIGANDLDALYRRDLKAYALVVLNIARELSRRLRVTDGILAGLVAQVHESLVTRNDRIATGGLLSAVRV